VVGGGPAKGALEEAVAGHGGRVRLAGPQPLESIPRWLAACDVLVLPSHAEGTPNVILEALACGRRVVATAVGGVPDLVTCDELGALVPPRDPGALGAAIARALETPYDPAQVARLGARGGWEASAAALHAVLVEAARVRGEQ
jgi:glycosyltransferase involved in cell wall biosynthesis